MRAHNSEEALGIITLMYLPIHFKINMAINANDEFYSLFLKVSQNKLSLEYIDEILFFCKKFEVQADFKHMEFKCKNLISMIYAFNKLPEKSLEIDLKLLSNTPNDYSGYFSVINGATVTSAELNRTNEVAPFAISYIKNQDDSFNGKLPVLKWYIDNYPNGENGSFNGFEFALSKIAAKMGAKMGRSLSFVERVNFFYQELVRASKGLHEFQVKVKSTPIEQRRAMIDDYLANENLGWFKEYVIQHYRK